MAGLYNGLFAMADRETGSVWSHFEGAALFGSIAGARLELVPLVQMRWADWSAAHPDGLVLDPDTGFEDRYRDRSTIGRPGLGPAFQQTLLHWDDRLAENELVLGVIHGGEARAYPLATLAATGPVVADELGGEPIVVLSDAGSGRAMAFSRAISGATLWFESVDGQSLDDQGGVWSIDGVCQAGWCAGRRLAFVTSFVTEWYGWAAYHPDTEIYVR